jgi:coenzyme F420-reducing hydrogenase beta subunit
MDTARLPRVGDLRPNGKGNVAMPSKTPAQARLMAIAAHTPGGYGGVPQSVGKDFNKADKGKKFNKGGAVTPSTEQAFENNLAEAVVYPGPSGWRRW